MWVHGGWVHGVTPPDLDVRPSVGAGLKHGVDDKLEAARIVRILEGGSPAQRTQGNQGNWYPQ